jgi:hypothetical protein
MVPSRSQLLESGLTLMGPFEKPRHPVPYKLDILSAQCGSPLLPLPIPRARTPSVFDRFGNDTWLE